MQPSSSACSQANFPPALRHGAIEEIFPDVFFVTGEMQTVLMEQDWQFSRNMTIVRDGERLILINSIRLDEEGLAALDRLGSVSDVVRLGALHGRDDAFYVDRYQATYWAMPGLEADGDLQANTLSNNTLLPISDASLFAFETSQIPEGILHLQREGGIVIACDALQNWLSPDEHFCEASTTRMQGMGFFTPANIGPVWLQAAQPQGDDFARLQALEFRHALCGHGEPLRDSAKAAYAATFSRLFS